ncbi:hypothetical protein pEaSNUABM47_00345 [Erwinia phage pEa_SNUABM_47]|uniref:Uncharacterized protein n=1 Tax=Erwinia phage pEa_SNUABM_47 TaxID=2768774 RepID=A0A7L8ZP72_9CAUD|nr:hypothetical protein pEaSNUABM47_00345 [Erwinia phage pEa_SNUABM_47]
MIIKVTQKVVSLEDCVYDIDVLNKIQKEIGSAYVVKYSVSPKNIVFYVEEHGSQFTIDMEVETQTYVLPVIAGYELLEKFPNAFKKTRKIGDSSVADIDNPVVAELHKDENAEINEYIRKMRNLVNSYIGKRIPNKQIEFVNGGAQIFEPNGDIVLLLDKYVLEFDPASFDIQDESEINTTLIRRSETIRDEYFFTSDEEITPEEINKILNETKEFLDELTYKEQQPEVSKISGTDEIQDLLNVFEAIEKDLPYAAAVPSYNEYEKNVQAMKELLINVRGADEDTTTMAQSVNTYTSMDATGELHAAPSKEVVALRWSKIPEGAASDGEYILNAPATEAEIEELTQEEVRELTKVQRTNEVIEVENAVISFDAFDSYASKHHVIGWDLATPSTLSIKFIEGITPESTIRKFHDMMDSLDTGWINKEYMKRLQDAEVSTKFLADLRNMIIDDKDIADEFITRVKKHNVFVRDSMAKIRAALLDMESDFERSLKSEVNLSIDWDKLTAYAAKKERTEHRVNGVRIISGNDGVDSNVVRVNSEYNNGDFFIPIHLLTDELRSKYVLEDYPHYIEDVPDYAFYEVHLNGHYILIENTEL